MIVYADTSGLAKKYIQEAGSSQVIQFLSKAEYLMTSALTELELAATFEFAKRLHRLDFPSYRKVIQALEKDLREQSITLVDIDSEVLHLAKKLIKIRRLRSPDAIQLATAIVIKKDLDSLQFLVADQVLIEAARLEGLKCLDVGE